MFTYDPSERFPVHNMPGALYWCDGVWRIERLGFGLYEVQCGRGLHDAGGPSERVTCTWLGPVDDFGAVVSLSDAAFGALDVTFSTSTADEA